MPLNSTMIHTFKCSILDCDKERVISGPVGLAKDTLLEENWILEETILGNEYDLCPKHADKLQTFLGLRNIYDS